jgi:hypothetical protein
MCDVVAIPSVTDFFGLIQTKQQIQQNIHPNKTDWHGKSFLAF